MDIIKSATPQVDSSLRHILRMPTECYAASGIVINGRRIKTAVFTTDLAIIKNCDADSVCGWRRGNTGHCTKIRRDFPAVPIIASGGNNPESILKTIEAGANTITYTPPSTQELFKKMMRRYREEAN